MSKIVTFVDDEINILKYSLHSIFHMEVIQRKLCQLYPNGKIGISFKQLSEINQLILNKKFCKEYYNLCDKLNIGYEWY